MQTLKERWEEMGSKGVSVTTYRRDLLNWLDMTQSVAKGNLEGAQQRQKSGHDENAKQWKIQVWDRVLILLPTLAKKLLMKWQGPFKIVHKAGPVDYEFF